MRLERRQSELPPSHSSRLQKEKCSPRALHDASSRSFQPVDLTDHFFSSEFSQETCDVEYAQAVTFTYHFVPCNTTKLPQRLQTLLTVDMHITNFQTLLKQCHAYTCVFNVLLESCNAPPTVGHIIKPAPQSADRYQSTPDNHSSTLRVTLSA